MLNRKGTTALQRIHSAEVPAVPELEKKKPQPKIVNMGRMHRDGLPANTELYQICIDRRFHAVAEVTFMPKVPLHPRTTLAIISGETITSCDGSCGVHEDLA